MRRHRCRGRKIEETQQAYDKAMDAGLYQCGNCGRWVCQRCFVHNEGEELGCLRCGKWWENPTPRLGINLEGME